MSGLRRRGLVDRITGLVRMGRGLVSAWRILRDVRPHLVVGVGGYASAPAVAAARARRVPTVLLEQNSVPGLTNRWLGRVADRVCVSFPGTERFFPKGRSVHTGNPVRLPESPVPVARSNPDRPLSILLFGGSAGAHRLNEVGVEAARLLQDRGLPFRIVHQTGQADLESVRERYREAKLEAELHPFLSDMPRAYGEADLVVCRAGATTIAELAAYGRPAILVPYPYAVDDHQRRNAETLVERDAAVMILDRELDPERLAREIHRLADDPSRLRRMGERARSLGRPDAAARVVDVCLGLIGRKAA